MRVKLAGYRFGFGSDRKKQLGMEGERREGDGRGGKRKSDKL